jgi:hypothetical protein
MLAGPISASLRVPPVSPFETGNPDRGLHRICLESGIFLAGGPHLRSASSPTRTPFPTGKPDSGLLVRAAYGANDKEPISEGPANLAWLEEEPQDQP